MSIGREPATLLRRLTVMKPLRAITTTVLAACLTLNGCGPSTNPSDEQATPGVGEISAAVTTDAGTQRTGEAVLITANRSGGGADEVGIEGTVMVENGCITIGSATVVIWAQGSQWDAEDQAIIRPSGLEFGLGEAVTLNGLSWTKDEAAAWLDESELEDFERCYSDGAVIVIDQ